VGLAQQAILLWAKTEALANTANNKRKDLFMIFFLSVNQGDFKMLVEPKIGEFVWKNKEVFGNYTKDTITTADRTFIYFLTIRMLNLL